MTSPIIAIIMGSDSDLAVMSEAAKVLEEFEIPFELTIVSAHRTPERMVAYAKTAADRGLKVIIAGAGGAAHLPGMTASLTTLPVIGVPILSKTLGSLGLDSIYSILQMPPGVPVATVAVNGAKNAGLLAIKIVASHDSALSKKITKYMEDLEKSVIVKAKNLEASGYKTYMQQQEK